MNFTGFYIDGYGIFHDLTLEGLSPRLVLFSGKNEAGKSTCLSFFRHMLFGFPDRRSKASDHAHPPLSGGRHGGALFIQTGQSGQITLERYKGAKGGTVAVTLADGSLGTMDDIAPLLGGITSTVYRNVYAFSLTELQTFESLKDDKVKGALYGAAMGSGLKDLPGIRQRLQTMAKGLFVPRGQKPVINQLLRELDAIEAELKECSTQLDQYKGAKTRLLGLKEQIDTLSKGLDEMEHRRRRLSIAVQVWDEFLRKNVLEQQLGNLEMVVETFPVDGLVRMEALLEQRENIKTDLAELDEEYMLLRQRKEELSQKLDKLLLKHEGRIKTLSERARDALKAEEDIESLSHKVDSIKNSLDQVLRSLGPAWSKDKLLSSDFSIAVKKEIDEWGRRIKKAEMALEHAKALMEEKEEQKKQAVRRVGEARSRFREFENVGPIADEETYELLHSQFGLFQTSASRLEAAERRLAQTKEEKQALIRRMDEARKLIPGGITDWEALLTLKREIRKAGLLSQALKGLMRDEEHLMALVSEKEFQKDLLDEKLKDAPLGIWKWVLPALGVAVAEVLALYLLLARDEPVIGGIIFIFAMAAALVYWKTEHEKESWVQRQNSQIEERIKGLMDELSSLHKRLAGIRDKQHRVERELEEVCRRTGLPQRPGEHELLERNQQLDEAGGYLESLEGMLKDARALTGLEKELVEEIKGLRAHIKDYVDAAKGVPCLGLQEGEETARLLKELPRFFSEYKRVEGLLEKKRSCRQLLQEAEKAAKEVEESFTDAAGRLKIAGDQLEKVMGEWKAWLEERGLDQGLAPSTAMEALQKIERGSALAAELESIELDIKQRKELVEGFNSDTSQLFSSLGRQCISDTSLGRAVLEIERELEQSNKIQIQMESLEERLEQVAKKGKGGRARLEQLEEEIGSLLSEAGAGSMEEFRMLHGWFAKRKKLLEELDNARARLSVLDAEGVAAEFLKSYGDKDLLMEELNKVEAQAEALKAEQKQLYEEQAETEHLVKELSTSERLEQLKFEKEILKHRLLEQVSEWSKYAMALHLLDEARHRFELEKQPRILQDAGRFFSIITNGRYDKVIASSDGGELEVIDRAGRRKSASWLSRGTAEQLYLALRFGYILNYGLKGEPLPVIMDDILVNFDPERAGNTIDTIAELSETHQVLFFTCHPETVSKFEARLPGVQHFLIEDGRITLQ